MTKVIPFKLSFNSYLFDQDFCFQELRRFVCQDWTLPLLCNKRRKKKEKWNPLKFNKINRCVTRIYDKSAKKAFCGVVVRKAYCHMKSNQNKKWLGLPWTWIGYISYFGNIWKSLVSCHFCHRLVEASY